MSTLAHNPAFMAYAIASVILCLHLIGVGMYADAVRKRARQANDDSRRSTMRDLEAPHVARAQRAQLDAIAGVVLFIVLGHIFVTLGASSFGARVYFGVFIFATLSHSFAQIAHKQILRSLGYAIGLLTALGMMAQIVMLLLKK